MSDRLALANAIEDAGIPRDKAAHVASVIVDLIHGSVATKADMQALSSALNAKFARQDVAIERLRTTIADLRHDLVLRGIGALVAGLTALFAALHYWPPHQG